MKIHLHEEQFDGWKHSACYRLSEPPEGVRIAFEEAFSKLPRAQRCAICTRANWPKGFGDPE